MQHKCKYYTIAKGELVCSVCGKPVNAPVIEDKNQLKPETKRKTAP